MHVLLTQADPGCECNSEHRCLHTPLPFSAFCEKTMFAVKHSPFSMLRTGGQQFLPSGGAQRKLLIVGERDAAVCNVSSGAAEV
jgi:hypothetical protein